MMRRTSREFLGNGLVFPLRRDGGSDFVSSSGVDLVRSCISQIVSTFLGELRWRPTFGLDLQKYKNRGNTDVLSDLVSDSIQSAIHRYEPRVNVLTVTADRNGNALNVKISWTLIDKNSPSNQVILGPDTFEVRI